MSVWCFGRYFLFKDDVRSLFQWLHEHIGDEWVVDVLGVCLNEDKLILNTVFGSEEQLKLFQKNYIGDQSHYASVYINRRKPEFKCRKKSKDAAAVTAGPTKIAVLLNGQNRTDLKMLLNVQWIEKE